MPRLRRSDCSAPGIARRRRGRGFQFLGPDGETIKDSELLARIRELAIPPAWRDVWICADPLGHLQATGIDDAGRKQYRYHDLWRTRRDAEKFERMLEFGRALPAMRRRVLEDLAREQIDLRRVSACALRLLDLGAFRIGSEEYTEQHATFGLTTVERQHVRVRGSAMEFDYPAKGGRRWQVTIDDAPVAETVGSLRRRRGGSARLLAHKEGGRWRDVHAEDVNRYIRTLAEADFTAKDFRTWNATVLAAVAVAQHATTSPTKTAARRR